jgi:putative DNA primase/helicase
MKFLDCFKDPVFRYIDQTGEGRAPVSSNIERSDLNIQGYEAYFTPNGFHNTYNAKKESCTSLNSFYIDIDGRKDIQELEEIKKLLCPTFIIETGNGYHLYWLLKEPIEKKNTAKWEDKMKEWEAIERSIVSQLRADPAVKDIPRILRQPKTFYWKKTGSKYKQGTDGVFVIKGIYQNVQARYSIEEVAKVFPPIEEQTAPTVISGDERVLRYAENEKKSFFSKVNEEYPIEQRDSFKKLISGDAQALPAEGMRNNALLVVSSLAKQAGWTKDKTLEHLKEIGWHGLPWNEIANTVNSAYSSGYTFSYKNEIIAYNMSPEEQLKIQEAYAKVSKIRRETDKTRFSTYEKEIVARYPNLRKNEIGLLFNYENGVYKLMEDLSIESLILNGLFDDMLWGFRTRKNVSDKIACLLSIIKLFKNNMDNGFTVNLKNGILNLATEELNPHTPDIMTLVQFDAEYDPNAECPIWLDCIDAWTEGPEQEEKKILLQQFAGYCLTSSMRMNKALFLIGDGGNGKSTFVDTIAMVLGPAATSHIDLEGLYRQYGMKGIIGKRLNIIEEVPGNYYQSDKLKKLISGEPITIDIKYKDQFTFTPECKFIFAVNQMPRVDDTSTATERRILVVEFLNNFRDNPDTTLRYKGGELYKERNGILNWMIKGLKMLTKDGQFIETKEQKRILKEYRGENSSVDAFVTECLDFSPEYKISARVLYDEYKRYCISDGRKFKANMVFTKELIAYGKKNKNIFFCPRVTGLIGAYFEGIKLSRSWIKESGTLNSIIED